MDEGLESAITQAAATTPSPVTDAALTPPEEQKMIERNEPVVEESRRQLVARWASRVAEAKDYWGPVFQRMRDDSKFVSGAQWPKSPGTAIPGLEPEPQYVANITLRHVQQRTATLYGKNPKVVAKRKKRLLSTVWDGTHQQYTEAMQSTQAAMAVGLQPDPMAVQIVAEVEQVRAQNRLLDRIAETLQLLFEYQLSEQVHPFKVMMKEVVRRTLTVGVGYVKLGFQRAMKMRPEIERQIADLSERLATIERLSADIADGEVDPNAPEVEQLRLTMKQLSSEPQQIVREGLSFDYPDSWAIIPDTRCKRLRGFIGSRWVAEEFMLSSDDIKEVYGVDVANSAARTYRQSGSIADKVVQALSGEDKAPEEAGLYCVWEIYSRKDGLVYTVCDGYPDFLVEPAAPDALLERFWPWFAYTTNEVYNEKDIFPPSDVSLIRDMQMEINRSRQGLREHRRAARPKTVVASGTLDDEDKGKLSNHPANAIIELNGLQPGQAVDQVLQAYKGPPIDPALYDTNMAFEDILRTVGTQEADLGGTSGATATETSIAQASRTTATGSAVDDLDELLTELARAGGQILLMNVQKQTVQEIVGPGAVWPELNREQIAKEIYLEVEAASTGRPNKAAETQNAAQIIPLLMQVPGVTAEFVAGELIKRLDDRLEVTDAIMSGMPSIMALNRAAQMPLGGAGDPSKDPNQQGDQPGQGAENPDTDPGRSNAPNNPTPPPANPAPNPMG